MRVITGSARGRKLCSVPGNDTRPTSEMAKEAVFSILHNEVPQARVLDLFAGSGQMGIEALSRGAAHVVFVDKSPAARDVIRENLKLTGFAVSATVLMADFAGYLSTNREKFDIAFLDPPYGKGYAAAALEALAEHMQDGGVILCECERTEEVPQSAGGFTAVRSYKYGKIKMTQYRKREDGANDQTGSVSGQL